jgi:hypothetical protein
MNYDIADSGETKGKTKEEEEEITSDSDGRNLFNRVLA